MFGRQTTGSVVCVSCGYLVGVNDDRCYNCGRRNPGLWGFATAVRRLGSDLGFIPFVIGLSVVMYGLTLIGSRGNIGGSSMFTMISPSSNSLLLFGASGAVPVFMFDRWWTVLSASWLHGGLLHIFFNMYWVRQLGPAVSDLYGPGRLVIIYTVAGVVGFTLTSLAGAYLQFLPLAILRGAPLTVGASASIFGLLGALVYYGRRTGSSQTYTQALQYAVIMFVFGLIMPGIDNYAHAGGFIGGYAASRLLDPLTPERINHMVWALVCIVLSVLSIVVSVVHGLMLG
ncbi:MAG: rhomboid family intramembrane serine protease [Acidobacteria bacterium]|nr:rhomboid family intramembrane serine protease [Acidobacteriota bacterium]